jgi:hypothetical protein
MFPHHLRRRARKSRSNPVSLKLQQREPPRRWRRPLGWAALITLVAAALYFATEKEHPAPHGLELEGRSEALTPPAR